MRLLFLLLAACAGGKTDSDGDGFSAEVDCNDSNPDIHPKATEVCDGDDNDCNGDTDDDAVDGIALYADADGDGYGTESTPTQGCTAGDGLSEQSGDCDDSNPKVYPTAPEDDCTDPVDYNCDGSIAAVDADADGFVACEDCNDQDPALHPGAPERCNGVDDDCDQALDDADPDIQATTWYRDPDGDGYADGTGPTLQQCDAPIGYTDTIGDCNNLDPLVHPGATEICDAAHVDEDCDGYADDADASTDSSSYLAWFRDSDGDGYGDASRGVTQCDAPAGYVGDSGDCDDGNTEISPLATEVCDGIDNNCDGLGDDDDPQVTNPSTWYVDGDGDGYGNVTRLACLQPTGTVTIAGDCNDGDPAISPGALEICDPQDQDENCDGRADDSSAAGQFTWYEDGDGDGYGVAMQRSCEPIAGYAAQAGDCNDGDPAISPAATEICDPSDVDENCNGTADNADGVGTTVAYLDGDGDGYGDGSQQFCDVPIGYVLVDGDCDDNDPSISPQATEICDPKDTDENCDGFADDATATGLQPWYPDQDGDGVGGTSLLSACDAPSGYVTTSSDCDDQQASVYPQAPEVCDGLDNNCDGVVDENLDQTWYLDADQDGYGASNSRTQCSQPVGYVASSGDCDDNDATRSPAEPEVCDASNRDENCNGLADDQDPGVTNTVTWYADLDGDTYGAASREACDAQSGEITTGGDCDDGASTVHPGATEDCDSVDNNCDGTVDEHCYPLWNGSYTVGDADTKIYGDARYDLYGKGVAAGDWNGDGQMDIAVGAPDDEVSTTYNNYGVTHIYNGTVATGTFDSSTGYDAQIYSTNATYTDFGDHLWTLPDMNKDGSDELVVATRDKTYYWDVSIYRGADWSLHNAGLDCTDVSGAGNLYTGGSNYLACSYITTSSDKGMVYVYSDTSNVPLISFYGELSGDNAGKSIECASDLDGDGVSDALIGTPYDADAGSNAGAVYVVYGPVKGNYVLSGADVKILGSVNNDTLGYQVAAGDLNQDGVDDAILGARSYDYAGRSASGAAYIFESFSSRVTYASSADHIVYGETAGDKVGECEFSTGDVDGDGENDLLIPTLSDSNGGSAAGGAWLLYGPLAATYDLSTDADVVWRGESAISYVGHQATIAGDTNSDGYDDVLLGGYGADEGTLVDRGAVWLILGG